jgi:HNH endonuclease
MARPTSILFVIDSTTGCWEWQGLLSWNGYARIRRDNRLQWAHRYYYEQQNGPIPVGKDLDHLCRNTRCVNPNHLEVVSKAENQRRGDAVRLSWEAVEFIRTRYQPGHPQYGQRALGRLFNVSHAAIAKVLNDHSWLQEAKGGQ